MANFRWDYPPGTEHDPRAPWNEPEQDPDNEPRDPDDYDEVDSDD